MTPRDFCYWLQGFFELTGESDVNGNYLTLDRTQIQILKDHLKLVFDKQTPDRTTTDQSIKSTNSTFTPLNDVKPFDFTNMPVNCGISLKEELRENPPDYPHPKVWINKNDPPVSC